MRMIPLGRTGLTVSEICLGTMTWGNRNSEAEGHAQIAMALDRGVNFLDTAEMYPVAPIRAETVGHTEAVIGTWLAANGGRDRMVIATKVTGEGMVQVRGGIPITPATIREAVEGSLRRLQTDYIDLYQLHWPNRDTYHFRDIWTFAPKPGRAALVAEIDAILACLGDLVAAGKLRHVGLSNETVWGASLWLARAEALGFPRMMTVQNEYSLLCRQFDSDWAELAVMEDMPLLAFSPLATGLLSGKYRGDATPPGSRRAVVPALGGRITPQVFPAVEAYCAIAERHGLDPVQMAIAWCLTRPFPCLPIIGATSVDQLALCIGAADVRLTPEVLAEIGAAHRAHPQPF
jgi:aryl-alcohol dehydrogenase-like predicted oxidoreductase